MKILTFITYIALIHFATSQIYSWNGVATYLYPIPIGNATVGSCCTPQSPLTITQANNTISFTIFAANNSNCQNNNYTNGTLYPNGTSIPNATNTPDPYGSLDPNGFGITTSGHTIIDGFFNDTTNGISGIFYPNNYSMQLTVNNSNCAWVFGTNQTSATTFGPYNLAGMWTTMQTIQYDNTIVSCCLPSQNITITQASNTSTSINILGNFPTSQGCTVAGIASTQFNLTETMVGGGFVDLVGLVGLGGNPIYGPFSGYYYPNSSTFGLLYYGCGTFFYNVNWTTNAQAVQGTPNATLINSLFNWDNSRVCVSSLYVSLVGVVMHILS